MVDVRERIKLRVSNLPAGVTQAIMERLWEIAEQVPEEAWATLMPVYPVELKVRVPGWAAPMYRIFVGENSDTAWSSPSVELLQLHMKWALGLLPWDGESVKLHGKLFGQPDVWVNYGNWD